jgi:membrane protein YdbS with pleckstrin-like domain
MMDQETRSVLLEWKPAIRLKSLYRIYLLLFAWIGILTWLVPLVFFIPAIWSLIITIPLFILIILVSLWISWYYDALAYTFTTNEIVWRRGVWFRRTGIVPYNRITNIDLIQGPLMRWVGVSTLKVQTAGYSAPSGASSEIRIEGTDQPEDLRSLIMGFVRGYNPVAVQTCTHEEQSAFPSQILAELVQIRRLLEEERER